MSDELIDIYSKNNHSLGIKKMKSAAHKKGLWHRSAHIWIYTSRGEILLQLRSSNKKMYPTRWDISAAGHVVAGEEPISAAIRELKEEIGLDVAQENLEFFEIRKIQATYRNIINNEFVYVYFLKFDGDVEELTLQEDEVSEIQFISIDKVKEDLKTSPNKYVPHGEYWFDVIKKVKENIK